VPKKNSKNAVVRELWVYSNLSTEDAGIVYAHKD
jgi:hypothetical protein